MLPVALSLASGCGDGHSGNQLFEANRDETSAGASARGGSDAAAGAAMDKGGRAETAAGTPSVGGSDASSAGISSTGGSLSAGADAGGGAGGIAGGGGVSGAGAGGSAGSDAAGGEGAGGEGGVPTTDGCTVSEIVTSAVFDQLFPPKTRNGFYTYEGFLGAAAAYPELGAEGDCDTRKRDLAALFANVARQTSQLRYVEQLNKSTQCASNVTYAPCAPGKKYYGRGPMQLTWNYNYYAASTCLGLGTALLTEPDTVATDAVTAWRTGLWFWLTGGANRCKKKEASCASPPDTSSCDSPHRAMVTGRGFGATIDLVNGAIECGDKPDEAAKAAVRERVCFYRSFVQILGTSEGPGSQTCGSDIASCD